MERVHYLLLKNLKVSTVVSLLSEKNYVIFHINKFKSNSKCIVNLIGYFINGWSRRFISCSPGKIWYSSFCFYMLFMFCVKPELWMFLPNTAIRDQITYPTVCVLNMYPSIKNLKWDIKGLNYRIIPQSISLGLRSCKKLTLFRLFCSGYCVSI